MRHRYSHIKRCSIVALLLLVLFCVGQPQATGQTNTRSIDFFAGVDFNFRDINYNTQYEFLIRITPGFK